mmetsp:Transcript_18074/g.23786  ORF Transcript_18074/g.23786 Transcript_18074/m.23786 type:complete len:160 (-) Transcript_18074:213-692(-)|eukprot:CAMPEP_0117755120 /NCGR_PEP_ID=MMETSP0947-20121206/13255_1 /TAXON_ID=44440 /ORGANISM="Chattonella subsalsa, Strain CCMP2191" /LENGTH=159 /DNA_ID=CAMNT_0005574379 /DNA_START=110 /DNA_END=589 /DNA_ORIENTATION=+
MSITLEKAQAIATAVIAKAREMNLNPICVTVLDERGATKLTMVEDGSRPMASEIAHGKANGAFKLSTGSRALKARAEREPYFIQAMNALAKGALVPVPGGVLVKDNESNIIGSVGVTGDVSDNDEIAAVSGIEAVGYVADSGAPPMKEPTEPAAKKLKT